MTMEFADYNKLLSRLRLLIEERSPRLIGIDGYMAAGKSHLSRRLATDLGAAVVESDNFSLALMYPDGSRDKPRSTPYIDCLDLDALSAKVTATLATSSLVIIEGVCIGEVLAKIGRRVGLTIYAKCISRDSKLWHRDIDLEAFETGSEKFGNLHRDELAYHSRVRPHEKADLMFVREEEEPPEAIYVARR